MTTAELHLMPVSSSIQDDLKKKPDVYGDKSEIPSYEDASKKAFQLDGYLRPFESALKSRYLASNGFSGPLMY